MKKPSKTYDTPGLSLLDFSTEGIICGSPQVGGNEDVGYEDWTI